MYLHLDGFTSEGEAGALLTVNRARARLTVLRIRRAVGSPFPDGPEIRSFAAESALDTNQRLDHT